jgi:hypothetical protein
MSEHTHKKMAIGLLAAVMLIIIILQCWHTEGFSTKREKASAIFDWFSSNKTSISYIKYKKDLGNESNIVEYGDVMKLFKERNLTVDSVEKII